MRHIFLSVALCASLLGPAYGQDLFIKNDRYTGPIQSRDGVIWVGLKRMGELLKLQVTEVNGGYLVGRPFYQHKEDPATGTVVVEGVVVESDGDLVPLPAFARALGLEVGTGRDAGSAALNPPFGWVRGADQAPAGPVVAAGPVPPLELNKATPGQEFDWRPHLVRGRINLVHFYKRGESDKGYAQQPALLRQLAASRGDVYVIMIDAGTRNSPIGMKLGMVPTTWVYGKGLKLRTELNGHSGNSTITQWLSSPQLLTDKVKGF